MPIPFTARKAIPCSRLAAIFAGKKIHLTGKGLLFLLLFLHASANYAANTPKVLTAKAEPRPGKAVIDLFTTVEPIHDIVFRSAATGTLEGIRLKPGDHVTRGERIGHLGGATYAAALASARAAAKMAAKALSLARDRLTVDKARYPLLVDRGALDRGRLRIARDRDNLTRTRAVLEALQKHGTLTSPVSGTIIQITSGSGERVKPGEKLLVVQPAGRLWLVGSLFGRDTGRVRIGMHGEFRPGGGGASIPVRIDRIFPRRAGNGVGIGLEATLSAPGWSSGEGGMVTLYARTGNEPAVPDSALVLDRGHWWVISSSDGHMKPVRVVPDGSRNGWTWISDGLKPGTAIVVSDAYLIFHKSFAKDYSGD